MLTGLQDYQDYQQTNIYHRIHRFMLEDLIITVLALIMIFEKYTFPIKILNSTLSLPPSIHQPTHPFFRLSVFSVSLCSVSPFLVINSLVPERGPPNLLHLSMVPSQALIFHSRICQLLRLKIKAKRNKRKNNTFFFLLLAGTCIEEN